ncbi:MAG TPA: M14 family metallopeptidase [Woeseiaceae bacterium]
MHSPNALTWRSGSGCSTASAGIAFNFDTAPSAACAVLGEREFAVLVAPEHAPPINPSPWYAFKYVARGTAGISVRLDYMGARHRYPPKLIRGTTITPLQAEVSADRSSARIDLPAGNGTVAAQELIASEQYELLIDRLSGFSRASKIDLGKSLDGRPISAVRLGDPAAPRLVVLLGRQHPPEVTGAIAMEAFLLELANRFEAGGPAGDKVQFLIVPQINPDGVARGHWRANRGGKDLNRDWGDFSQPETRAVKVWLDALPNGVRPVAMIDFHSTNRNLFYVQSEDETDDREERFLAGWLEANQAAVDGYPFRIERRDANPGRGTAKNWFHRTYDIPAYTYEVGDDTERESITRAAIQLARSYVDQLEILTLKDGP